MVPSRRAYAALRWVSVAAVRKALAKGRIALEADGTTAAAKADFCGGASKDATKGRGALD